MTGLTPQQALEMFLLDIQSRNLSSRTAEYYQTNLRWFFAWLESNGGLPATLDAITATHIRNYLNALRERKKPSSIHAAARAIKAYFGFCVRDELLAVSPMAKVKMPKVPSVILPSFTPDEVTAVLKECKTVRDRTICYVLLDSGVRASELVNLRSADVNLLTGEVKVRLGKGGKDRLTFVGAATRKHLLKYFASGRGKPEPEEFIFLDLHNKEPLQVNGLIQMMRKLRLSSGVKICSCHTFRRTFAITMLRNGTDVYTLQRLMGHEDLDVLKRYLRIIDSDVLAAAQRGSVVDNMRLK